MNMQMAFVFIVFVLAMVFIARKAFRDISFKKSCNTGCGKCGIDFSDKKSGVRQ